MEVKESIKQTKKEEAILEKRIAVAKEGTKWWLWGTCTAVGITLFFVCIVVIHFCCNKKEESEDDIDFSRF